MGKIIIGEAIIDLSIQREVKRRLGKDHQADAIGLGLESLEQLRDWRKGGVLGLDEALPSETK